LGIRNWRLQALHKNISSFINVLSYCFQGIDCSFPCACLNGNLHRKVRTLQDANAVHLLNLQKNTFLSTILETTGNISFYFYRDEEVHFGLPVLPKIYNKKVTTIEKEDIYACTYCGYSAYLERSVKVCERCERKEWVKAIKTLRLT